MADPQDELAVLRAQVASLTARVHRLEQKAGEEPVVSKGITTATAPPPPQVLPQEREQLPVRVPEAAPPPPPRPPVSQVRSAFHIESGKRVGEDLEGRIGKLWLNRIGIAALLFGVAYFIKYAFDNGWIGPSGRIAIGLIAGILVVIWSERFRSKGYSIFAHALKAVGIGTLYLSLWGAFQIYHLIPSALAFAAMIIVTASTVALALSQDSQILALYALVGGFSTPLLLSTGQNHQIILFSYVFLLDLGMLVLARFKPWRRLMWASFLGTVTLYCGWYFSYYFPAERPATIFFAALFAATFAAIPLVSPLTLSRLYDGPSITLTLLPLANASAFFLALFFMYESASERVTLTWYALVLAAVYLGISSALRRRKVEHDQSAKVIHLLHVAIAIGFITIAIPIKLNDQWITIGWLVESAVLLVIAVRTQTDFLRYFAGCTLALGIFRLVFIDNFRIETLVFNARFATNLVAIAILAGIVAAGERFASEREMPFVRLAGVALNALALRALTLEVLDYFSRQMSAYGTRGPYQQINDLRLVRDFTLSAIYLAYGAGLMMFGFWKRSAFVRWQALVLIAFTIGKVFLYDVSMLQQGYRIVSFIALGAVLMGISYVYHRDWLRLSGKTAEGMRG
jgi:uncharacterized membrane protein